MLQMKPAFGMFLFLFLQLSFWIQLLRMSSSLSPGKIKFASSSQTAAPLTHGTSFRTINYKVSREIGFFLAISKPKLDVMKSIFYHLKMLLNSLTVLLNSELLKLQIPWVFSKVCGTKIKMLEWSQNDRFSFSSHGTLLHYLELFQTVIIIKKLSRVIMCNKTLIADWFNVYFMHTMWIGHNR